MTETKVKKTAVSEVDSLLEHLEKVQPGQEVRFTTAATTGDTIRQGDLYLTVVEIVPKDYKEAVPFIQLVPGQTQGAKHCLDSTQGVEMFLPEEWNEESLDGPCLILTEERKVLHPTHGHVTIPAGFTIQCSYQREFDKEQQKERRARD